MLKFSLVETVKLICIDIRRIQKQARTFFFALISLLVYL